MSDGYSLVNGTRTVTIRTENNARFQISSSPEFINGTDILRHRYDFGVSSILNTLFATTRASISMVGVKSDGAELQNWAASFLVGKPPNAWGLCSRRTALPPYALIWTNDENSAISGVSSKSLAITSADDNESQLRFHIGTEMRLMVNGHRSIGINTVNLSSAQGVSVGGNVFANDYIYPTNPSSLSGATTVLRNHLAHAADPLSMQAVKAPGDTLTVPLDFPSAAQMNSTGSTSAIQLPNLLCLTQVSNAVVVSTNAARSGSGFKIVSHASGGSQVTRFRVQQDGKVGNKNTTLQEQFDVSGTVRARRFLRQSLRYYIGYPVGAIVMYARASSSTTPPAGWLFCEGQAVSRTTYSALFSVIGGAYGSDATNFNLPDLRGRSPLGAGQGSSLTNRAINTTGGVQSVTLTTNEMPAHTHNISLGNHSHSHSGQTNDNWHQRHDVFIDNHHRSFRGRNGNPRPLLRVNGGSIFNTHSQSTNHTHTVTVSTNANHTHTLTIGNIGSGNAHENMHPWIAIPFMIKT